VSLTTNNAALTETAPHSAVSDPAHRRRFPGSAVAASRPLTTRLCPAAQPTPACPPRQVRLRLHSLPEPPATAPVPRRPGRLQARLPADSQRPGGDTGRAPTPHQGSGSADRGGASPADQSGEQERPPEARHSGRPGTQERARGGDHGR